MKILAILLSVFLMNSSFAQTLNCKASGAVDGIVQLNFSSSDLEGQVCGQFLIKSLNGLPAKLTFICFNGSLKNESNVLVTAEAQYGENKISLRNNGKNEFSLVKAFYCDYNHEEQCNSGSEEILSEEKLQCD